MRTFYRLGGVIGAAGLLFAICLFTVIAQAAPATPTLNANTEEALPVVGFVADGGAVNAPGQSGLAPALAVNPNTHEPWVAFVQNNQLIVSKFISATKTWAPQGDTINLNPMAISDRPALTFGGADANTPWVAWSEGEGRILVARLVGGHWTVTGNGSPVLNQSQNPWAYDPALAIGAPFTGGTPLPWVAWAESNGFIGHVEIRRAVSDAGALGGIRWQQVVTPTSPDAPAKPDLVFSGPANRTPWLAWYTGTDIPEFHVFVARAISDTAAVGGFRWEKMTSQANCQETASSNACALNPANQSAATIRLASGVLPGEIAPTPWVVFAQTNAGKSELRVMRLDIGTPADPSDDRFIPVGDTVNTQCLQRDGLTAQSASQPDIYFVGNIPHVAWLENTNGLYRLYVCHLADARPGQERWDLDTITPINREPRATALWPSLGANGTTPYVAWQEGETASQVFVAHRIPDDLAWGRNYPPFIRTISWYRNLVGQVFDTTGIQRALNHVDATTRPILFTTSCNHANGWEHIKEVQFKLANANMTAFFGKYVAAENQVYVAKETPGAFFAGVIPGTGQPVETRYVILNVPDMKIHNHGAGSPALDIDWFIVFKEATEFQDFDQSINIVYDNGQSTGFFKVGEASLDYRLYLPAVKK